MTYVSSLALEWHLASKRWRNAMLVLCGGTHDVRSLAECTSDAALPSGFAFLPDRLISNAVYFRANYARALAAWGFVCAVRHPSSALWLVCIASGIFHCLVVRRGVVHVQLPSADPKVRPLATLMWPTLHAALAGGSMLLLLIIGRLGYLLWLVFPPLALALAHATLRAPAVRLGETERQLTELIVAVQAAIRGEADSGADVELEAGGDELDEFAVSTPERNEAMAARVEAIRNKYRPPIHGGTKRNVD